MSKAKSNEVEKIARPVRVRKAALVLPTYSLKSVETGDTIAIKVTSEITDKPDVETKGEKAGQQKLDKLNKPAFLHLVNVEDLDTGEVGQMVLPYIIHEAFKGVASRDGSIAGKAFELVKGKAESNKATMWEIYEIEA